MSGFQFVIDRQSAKYSVNNQAKQPAVDFTDGEIRQITLSADRQEINDQELEVEVVTKSDSILQGLSGREEIGSDGMLFVFPEEGRPSFWMKEMKFDLDLIWINDGKVVEITADVPHPDPETPLSALPTYSPQQPVDMVLEMAAGEAGKRKILVGSTLQFAKR